MDKPLKRLRTERRVRTGRASLAVPDGIRVDYYGSHPVVGRGQPVGPRAPHDHRQAQDQTMLPTIEKSIGASGLGINPQNDGKIIVVFPS